MKKYLFLLSLLSFSCVADWTLDKEKSALTFVSTKQSHIREVHQIQQFDVTVDKSSSILVKMDLSSVESGIPIRNERMQKMLFEVSKFRFAELSVKLPEAIDSITGPKVFDVTGQLSLRGKSASLPLRILVSRAGDEIVATLLKPIILNAAQFDLQAGIDALQKVAGLKSIGYSVPVQATLVLKR